MRRDGSIVRSRNKAKTGWSEFVRWIRCACVQELLWLSGITFRGYRPLNLSTKHIFHQINSQLTAMTASPQLLACLENMHGISGGDAGLRSVDSEMSIVDRSKESCAVGDDDLQGVFIRAPAIILVSKCRAC